MEQIGKYLLHTHEEPAMKVRNFKWSAEDNKAFLDWAWPADTNVKLMLVFKLPEDEDADIRTLLTWGYEHQPVSRNLSSGFQSPLEDNQQRFMICPAYFNENKTVVVYKPELVTDWIYKKWKVSATTDYKPIRLSKYKQATLKIKLPPAATDIDKVLQYGIYENNRLIGVYPMDNESIIGNYKIYIRKNQEIRFMIDKDYANRFEIE